MREIRVCRVRGGYEREGLWMRVGSLQGPGHATGNLAAASLSAKAGPFAGCVRMPASKFKSKKSTPPAPASWVLGYFSVPVLTRRPDCHCPASSRRRSPLCIAMHEAGFVCAGVRKEARLVFGWPIGLSSALYFRRPD